MEFEQKYLQIKKIINSKLQSVENEINKISCGSDLLQSELISIIKAPSKRIRPVLNLLYLKMLDSNISNSQIILQSAIELIHNATLIHDDVIDNSAKRRNHKTLNAKFDNSLAVVSGDLLLTIAIQKILQINIPEITEIFNNALMNMCKGEINQYFNKFKIPTMEEYLEKCKNKTSQLFMSGLKASLIVSQTVDEDAEDFAKSFGTAFQIRDDLLNIIQYNSDKPVQSDIEEGIYTAPVIFAGNIENLNIGIEKTKLLLDNYIERVKNILNSKPNNQYRQALMSLAEILRIS